MRNWLLIFGVCLMATCLVGCSGDTSATCSECGKTAAVNDAQLCKECASYVSEGATESTGESTGGSGGGGAGGATTRGAAKESADGKHYGGWGRDYQAGLARAKAENKSMLVLFTGSDWCPPCKSLHEKVFTSSEFQAEIPDSVVLVVCDNPRDDSLVTPEERTQYKELAPKFNVSGVPSMFLTDSEGEPYHKMVGYGGTPAGEWVSDLKAKIAANAAK